MAKVIIIGGGASGLVAAIYASKNNDVTILEKNSKCGKKILVTGNGKCNYWNENFDTTYFNSSNKELIKEIVNNENKKEIMNFFDSIGIIPNIVDGYYYPLSNQAVTIQTSLIKEAKVHGVNIKCDTEVLDIKYDGKYKIITNNGNYVCDKVILSTGSFSWVKENNGYELLKKYDKNIIKPLPALVQLTTNDKRLKDSNGVRCNVEITLIENEKPIKKESGQLQITDYGISGICVFQLSSLVSRGLDNGKCEKLIINFMPWLNCDFINFMDNRNNKMKNRTISELLDGMFNYKLVNNILKICKIKENEKWDNIDNNKKKLLKTCFTEFTVEIDGTKGFINSQTCTGGLSLKEINLKTMELLNQKGMYVTGEIIDIDGMCGGYNLGIAWITGMIAGSNI